VGAPGSYNALVVVTGGSGLSERIIDSATVGDIIQTLKSEGNSIQNQNSKNTTSQGLGQPSAVPQSQPPTLNTSTPSYIQPQPSPASNSTQTSTYNQSSPSTQIQASASNQSRSSLLTQTQSPVPSTQAPPLQVPILPNSTA
jgi:hypothetical protein